MKNIAILAALVAACSSANAQLKITEVMYKGMFGEFIEVTNTGSALTASQTDDYSYDDSGASAGKVPFPAVALANNQCVIITEVSSAIFNLAWYTEPSGDNGLITVAPVIIGNSTDNLGRSDTINIFQNSTVVDKLSYNDEAVPPNGPRTEDVSAVPITGWDHTLDNMTNGGVTEWKLSNTSDVATKWQAGNPSQSAGSAPIGSPGRYVTATP
ncbi:hypothetical protein [Luteolibacter luteus]|uniref:Lamin tail domain-containing protein n=1 Tax=Luteolibacter luteus TaxID=2728835 RepID=A0A858RNS5_9BACT|nr:hypothetical protein [Luteolibacter luteus]QJE97979.1 lamin tail domain-containing protein [Luteolibacter luteus]